MVSFIYNFTYNIKMFKDTYVACGSFDIVKCDNHLRLVAGLLSSRNLEYASLTGSCRCVHK